MGSAGSSEGRQLVHLPGFSLTSYRENHEEWEKKKSSRLVKHVDKVLRIFHI